MAKVEFTAKRVEEHFCPPEKSQAFIWDKGAVGLGLRVTPRGDKNFFFQSKLNGNTMRIAIGKPGTWTIKSAQIEARRLQTIIDGGKDPRIVMNDILIAEQEARDSRQAAIAAAAAKSAERIARETITFGIAWEVYLKDRKKSWGDRHYQDHIQKASSGGVSATRGTRGRKVTVAGPLHYFLHVPLCQIDTTLVETWASIEGAVRPTSARLALRLFNAFCQWCQEQPEYQSLISSFSPGKTKRTRERLGSANVKNDYLSKSQLAIWFDSVRKINNPTISAFMQTLLLTGARPGEILSLRWEDINWSRSEIMLRDKIEGTRAIPLTPYVSFLLNGLTKIGNNNYVFASASSEDGKLTSPNAIHHEVCELAKVGPVTLHGLRRSFATLTNQFKLDDGVAMQIQGHKPVSSREKHYIRWEMDHLKEAHFEIEKKLLELGRVETMPASVEKSTDERPPLASL